MHGYKLKVQKNKNKNKSKGAHSLYTFDQQSNPPWLNPRRQIKQAI